MECTSARPLLVAWQDGELDATQAAAVDAHLETCAACAGHERRLRDATPEASLPLPAFFTRRSWERLDGALARARFDTRATDSKHRAS